MSDSNFVTFEIAKALKSAGFPKPPFAKNQHWYSNPDGYLNRITQIEPNLWVFSYLFKEEVELEQSHLNGQDAFFAPTVEDLLEKLPPSYGSATLKPVMRTFSEEPNSPVQVRYDADAYARIWIEENSKN